MIDDSLFIISAFNKDSTFKDIGDKYISNVDSQIDKIVSYVCSNSNFGVCPLIHIWVQFGLIKKNLCPIDNKITVTEEDLKDINNKKWVEIP